VEADVQSCNLLRCTEKLLSAGILKENTKVPQMCYGNSTILNPEVTNVQKKMQRTMQCSEIPRKIRKQYNNKNKEFLLELTKPIAVIFRLT
jgi:hypothetical protein